MTGMSPCITTDPASHAWCLRCQRSATVVECALHTCRWERGPSFCGGLEFCWNLLLDVLMHDCDSGWTVVRRTTFVRCRRLVNGVRPVFESVDLSMTTPIPTPTPTHPNTHTHMQEWHHEQVRTWQQYAALHAGHRTQQCGCASPTCMHPHESAGSRTAKLSFSSSCSSFAGKEEPAAGPYFCFARL